MIDNGKTAQTMDLAVHHAFVPVISETYLLVMECWRIYGQTIRMVVVVGIGEFSTLGKKEDAGNAQARTLIPAVKTVDLRLSAILGQETCMYSGIDAIYSPPDEKDSTNLNIRRIDSPLLPLIIFY